MGYETKLVVVNKTNQVHEINGERMVWAEKIAEFNLCKVHEISDKMRRYPITNAFYYADDGNTEVVEDQCGDRLREIPLLDAINIIDFAMRTQDYYRRYSPCLELLKGFNPSDWADLVVLHYGY